MSRRPDIFAVRVGMLVVAVAAFGIMTCTIVSVHG
jgi:hypothetical protein